MSPWIRVAGVPLTSKWWGGLKITNQWPRGCWQADWSMALGPAERPPMLVKYAQVEILIGSRVIWAGFLTDLNWDDGTFSAAGAAREGEEALSFTAAGVNTSTPDIAIDTAIANGNVTWTRPASVSATPIATGDQPEEMNYLTDLLDSAMNMLGKQWAVNADRQVYAASDPTTPSYLIAYGSAVLGVASDALVGQLCGGWYDTSGVPHVTRYPTVAPVGGSLRPQVAVDMSPVNVTDATTATTILTNIYNQVGAQMALTNSVTVTASQVTSLGGVTPALWQITAGLVYRLNGLTDPRTGAAYADVLMGESVWDVDAGSVQLTPVGAAARDLSSIIADTGLTLL